jgi:hypothetical protein
MQNIEPANGPAIVRKTSKLGKTSFMIGLSIFCVVMVSMALALFFSLNDTKLSDNEMLVFVILWILAPFGHLIGLVMGIVDVCRKRSKKLTPALGIAGNAILGGIGIGGMFLILSVLGAALTAFR